MTRPALNVAWRTAVVIGMDRELCGESRRKVPGWIGAALEYGQTWARVVKARQWSGKAFP